jgi:hypothetical protein
VPCNGRRATIQLITITNGAGFVNLYVRKTYILRRTLIVCKGSSAALSPNYFTALLSRVVFVGKSAFRPGFNL